MPKRLWRQVAQAPRQLFKTPPPGGLVVHNREEGLYGRGIEPKRAGYIALVPELGDTYDPYFTKYNRYFPIQKGGYRREYQDRDVNAPPRLFRTEEEAATALHKLFDNDDEWQSLFAGHG